MQRVNIDLLKKYHKPDIKRESNLYLTPQRTVTRASQDGHKKKKEFALI